VINFLWRRALLAIPVLFGVIVLVFLVLRLIPGDPAQLLLIGTDSTPERVAELRTTLGLDQPLIVQFGDYVLQLLRGDLGYSYVSQTAVADEIVGRLPYTVNLTMAALGVGLLVGIPTGVAGGLAPGTFIDKIATGISVLGLAVPYFWVAQLLVLVFAVNFQIFPALGVGGPEALILPAVSLGLGLAAIITRILRASLIDIYQQPYILVARAKGLPDWWIFGRHAARNALTSVITVVGLQIGNLLSGAVATEVIFGRPGVGSFLVSQIQRKDIPTVQGIILIIAIAYVVINIVVDLMHGVLDPRVRKAWQS
jgi:peptide/nickel transport system permease protein